MDLFSRSQQKLEIEGKVGRLELALNAPKGPEMSEKIAVICHPHPQHGGTMENKVVTTLMRTYRDLGVGVVRFNYRGVGKSEGQYAEAVGEIEDLLAVIRWVRKQSPDTELLLAGFSFGSYISFAVAAQLARISHVTLVAPPVGKYGFDEVAMPALPMCVLQGSEDEIVDAQEVYQWSEAIGAELVKIEGTGHFFHGRLVEFKQVLTPLLADYI